MTYEDAFARQYKLMKRLYAAPAIANRRANPIAAIRLHIRWDEWFDRTDEGRKVGELMRRQADMIRSSW